MGSHIHMTKRLDKLNRLFLDGCDKKNKKKEEAEQVSWAQEIVDEYYHGKTHEI